ncbi:MAG: response regulator, partial [Phaeodactylibacter sp.]|nr:response regulator [Phaeodactylibacter sp.]
LEYDQEWLINISAAEVDLYIPLDSSRFTHLRSGSVLPFQERTFQGSYGLLPCLPLFIPAGDTLTLYFRLKGPGYPLRNDLAANFNQTIFRPEVYAEWSRRARFLDALIIGILLAVAIYHLIIFFYQRQYVSLFFSLFVLSVALLIMMFSGYSQEFFLSSYNLRNGIIFSPITYFLVYLFYYLFSRLYLKLPEILPVLDKIWAGLVLLDLASGALVVKMVLASGCLWNVDSGQFFTLVSARAIADLPLYLIPVVTAIAAWWKGNKAAGIYLVAILAFVLQSLANDVNAWFGILPLPQWIYGDIGPAIMVLLFAMGIARQLKTLQEEKFSAEQAELTERAEANRIRELDAFKSRFYTNITHEFRTPLTLILGAAEQLDKKSGKDPQKAQNLIQRQGRHLLNLINQLLSLSKLESNSLPLQEIQADIIPFIKGVAASFDSAAARKGLQLELQFDTDSLIMDFDPEKVQAILANLLSNALKFTPEGGRVQLNVKTKPESGSRQSAKKSHFRLRTSDLLQISVCDTGVGISPVQLPHIFDRFYQVDTSSIREGEGTGIGLALVKELVELMNGQIEVKSQPGKGSTFMATLPIRQSAPRPAAPVTPEGLQEDEEDIQPAGPPLFPDTESIEQPLVLVVEDNPDMRGFIHSLLEGAYRVQMAPDGEAGIQKAMELVPDLVISDVMMPKKDGFELCQALKQDERTSHIPIILLTAKASQEHRIEGLEYGADAYLEKPFNRRELEVRLEQLMALRKTLQQHFGQWPAASVEAAAGHSREAAFLLKVQRLILEKSDDKAFGVTELCLKTGM